MSLKAKILQLRNEEVSYRKIVDEIGCSISYVSKVCIAAGVSDIGLTTNGYHKRDTEYQKATWNRKVLDADFETLSWGRMRKRILLEQFNSCNQCGISEWQGKSLSLEIDHINGIGDDNRRDNLEAVCPNCHSIRPTWRGRNKPSINGEVKVTDEVLIEALKTEQNIRQALLKVGLVAKGNNYKRAKRLHASI